jgi:simple sugar transport system substrate-binding protein
MDGRTKSSAWRIVMLVLSIGVGLAAWTAGAAAKPGRNAADNAGQISIEMPFFGEQNAFFGVIQKGAQEAAKDLGVKLIWTVAGQNFSITAAANAMKTSLARKPTAWAVVDVNPAAMDPIIKQAKDAGITVIDINSGQNDPKRPYLFYIGQDEYLGGKFAGKSVWDASNGSLKRAGCMDQVIGDATLTLRCKGFASALKSHGVTVDTVDVSGGPTQAYSKTLAYLQSHADVGALYGLTAGPEAFDPIIKALKKVGKAGGKIKFVANDLSPNGLAAVKSGDALGLIDQQQFLQGYMAVQWAYLYLKYGLVPGSDILTGPSLVSAANVDKVKQLVADGYR